MDLTRFTGGVAEARSRYAGEASPALLLIESPAHAEIQAQDLESLAEVCVAGTNLILLGTRNDVAHYRDLLRRGVADYLVLPTEPMRLIEAVQDLYREPGKRPAGKVIAFIGVKGGCGNTTLACNVGWRLSRQTGADVVVADLDLPFGASDLAFNLDAPNSVQSVLADPDRVDESFLQRFSAKYGEHLYLLAAPASLDVEAAVSATSLEIAVANLRQQAGFVVLDLPRVWSEWVRQTLLSADHVVITATPDLASVRNARNLIDLLAGKRTLDQPPTLVLNRVGALRRGEVAVKDFAVTVGLEPALVIAEESVLFGQAASLGKMVEEVNGRSKGAEAIQKLAARFGGPAVGPAGSGGMPAWLRQLTGKG